MEHDSCGALVEVYFSPWFVSLGITQQMFQEKFHAAFQLPAVSIGTSANRDRGFWGPMRSLVRMP